MPISLSKVHVCHNYMYALCPSTNCNALVHHNLWFHRCDGVLWTTPRARKQAGILSVCEVDSKKLVAGILSVCEVDSKKLVAGILSVCEVDMAGPVYLIYLEDHSGDEPFDVGQFLVASASVNKVFITTSTL